MKKLLAFIISVLLSIQYIAGAVPIINKDVPVIDKKIFIPESYGLVEKYSFDKYVGSRFVILLKDAHCNYDAQYNIARILEVLIKDYKIDLVAIEGAVGDLDYSRFDKMENEPAREKMADSFVKKGVLSGPEYLKITKDGKLLFNIYGIENEKLYIENFITFREAISHQEETLIFINELARIVKNLKAKMYPKELLDFDNKSMQYYENTLPLTDWIKELNIESGKAGIVLKEYPNIILTLDSIALEEKVDFKKVEIERAEAIGDIEEILSKGDLKEMVEKSLRFRLGKISSSDYYEYLERLLESLSGVAPIEKFPNLTKYIQLVKLQTQMNNDALFSEAKRLEESIKEIMFQDNIQRQLDDISKKTRILNGLFKLTLNRDDLDYYRGNRAEFMPDSILSFLNIQAPLHDIPLSILLGDRGFLDKVTSVIADGEKFYDIAIKRDMGLVENTLRIMEERNKANAIMVIGGFHTEGVLNLFEEKGVGYAVITPKIVKAEKEGLYISLMMDKRIRLPQEGSTLSPLHPLAGGSENERLLADMGAKGISDELFELAMLEYHKYLGEHVGEIIEERLSLPFSLNVKPDGTVGVEINSDYTRGDETNLQLEWFRKGMEEAIAGNEDFKQFLSNPENAKRYLDRLAVAEYRLRTGNIMGEKAALDFATFYLRLCILYEQGGWISVRDELMKEVGARWKDFLPKNIGVQEFGKPDEWPKFKAELIKGLKGKGVSDEVVEGVVNYLFIMPAYGMDEKGEFYETLFFSSYLSFVREIFGVDRDEKLRKLFDQLQSYRFLQLYLAKIFKVEKTMPVSENDINNILGLMERQKADEAQKEQGVELLARYLSGETFSQEQERILNKLVGRKISEWRDTQWIKVASGVRIINESDISTPLKRNVYVTVLARESIKNILDASDGYERGMKKFEEELPTAEQGIASQKNRVYIHDISTQLGEVEGTETGYSYYDLGFPSVSLVRAVQRSKNNYQYFLYDPDKPQQKEAAKLYYLARHGIALDDRQFVTPAEYEKINREGRIVIAMLSNNMKGKVLPVKGDRVLYGHQGGTDLMLINRLALIVAEPEVIGTEESSRIEAGIRDLLTKKYYLDADRSGIDKLKISFENGIFVIDLPPMTPFVKEYYNSLMKAREVILKAA